MRSELEVKLALLQNNKINCEKERSNHNSEADLLTTQIETIDEEIDKIEGEIADLDLAESEEVASSFSQEHDDVDDSYQTGN